MMRATRAVVATGLLIAGALSPPPGRAGEPASGPVPNDVLLRSDIARTNMRFIAFALHIYADDHNGRLPTDLRELYPEWVPDPAMFWHPGDADPQPTTIDNNGPDQPNSTRVSYNFAGATWLDDLCPDEPLIWDNSAANNAGRFINIITAGVTIRTDPPFATPIPTRLQVAQGHLLALFVPLLAFANENGDRLPDDFAELALLGYVCSPSLFWNPGDSNAAPAQITNSLPDGPESAQVSFLYLAAGREASSIGPSEVLVQDNSAANNGGRGINILKANGRVEFISSCNDPFADADDDGDVDMDDFGAFQRCITAPGARLADGCGCFDRFASPVLSNGDGDVDQADFQRFRACASGSGVPADPICDDGT